MVKIKTLADAGVPLGRIKELLGADTDGFSAAVAEIDRKLQQRAQELLRTRKRLAQLRTGDRLFVSEEVADYLDVLRELGVSQRTIEAERDGWILLQSVAPQDAATLIAQKRAQIADPEFLALYLEYDAAANWSPNDPRLEDLAERTRRWIAHSHRKTAALDPTVVWLTSSLRVSSPAWRRLRNRRRGADF